MYITLYDFTKKQYTCLSLMHPEIKTKGKTKEEAVSEMELALQQTKNATVG
jgi:hypothetical protein